MRMIRKSLWVVMAIAAVIWIAAPLGFSQETKPEEDPCANCPQVAAATDDWLAGLSTPGEEHKRLDPLVGDWNIDITLWIDGPNEPPVRLQGTVSREWVLGGRFLQETSENPTTTGVFMSQGYYGYNRATGLYQHVWMTTESTGVFSEVGRFDPSANVFRTAGTWTDPATGYVIWNATELKITGPDLHTLTGWVTGSDGQEFKEIEVVHTRKQ